MQQVRNESRSLLCGAALQGGIFMLLLFCVASPVSATIAYRVSLENPAQHLFHVKMTVPAEGRQLTVALPAWNALYQIRDFSARLRDLSAACSAPARLPINVRALDKQTWRLSLAGPATLTDEDSNHTACDTVEIRYAMEWDDPGPFDSQLDDHHAFINLAEILMYVPERRDEPVSLTLDNIPADWKVAAELAGGTQANSFAATSYDALVDAPIEAGKFSELEFDSAGAHFRVVVGTPRGNLAAREQGRLEDELRRITAYELQLMGGPPFQTPRTEYTFLFRIGPHPDVGGGGMEHANSTAISAESVDAAAAISAHEFFHVWNVKRIRPQTLEPVDYTKEQYTRALWFAEGVTNTYMTFTLERTGLWSKEQFYGDLARQVCELQSRPARLWQSAEESSLDAWLEKYDAYNAPARSISYYDKGQILGVLLDVSIRDATENRKSLDDVMRWMFAEYAKQGKFYDDSAGVRSAVENVTGKSFADFFLQYVAGVQEIPYNDFLSLAGLQLKIESPQPPGGAEARPVCSISEAPHASDRQRRVREGLLRGTTN